MGDACVLIFTKPPTAGRVKTRLIGELSAEQAAALHQAFLEDVVARLELGSFEIRLAWALQPGESMPSSGHAGIEQRGQSLGARLQEALSSVGRSFDYVAAVGSDHPEISLAQVESAFDGLRSGADVVLGPATDGGYYLVALHGARIPPELFEGIAWSTSSVLASTLARVDTLGLELILLEEGHDVDTARDLSRLVAELTAEPPNCPATYRLLEEWGQLAS